MLENKEDEIQRIEKRIIVISILETPGAILLGLGLYGLFGADGDAFIEILNYREIAFAATIVGGAIMLWSIIAIIPLLKRKAQLAQQDN